MPQFKTEEDLKNDLNYLRKEEEANEALNQIRLITVVQSDPEKHLPQNPRN